MKEKMCVTLNSDHIYSCETKTIARSGENEITQLEITLEECLCKYWVYIDFIKPDGTKYKTSKLDLVGNVVTYDIPNSLLDLNGRLQAQIVLQDENGEVWKSTIKTYHIRASINATDEIENKDDFITEAQKLLNEVENGLTPTIGENGNWFILGKDTGKPSQGKGEKGDKGDVGAVKLIVVNELPSENIDESAIYMKPSENPNDENTYQEYIYVNGSWESIGGASVQVDLSEYAKITYVDEKFENLNGEVKVYTTNKSLNSASANTTITSLNNDGIYKAIQENTEETDTGFVLKPFVIKDGNQHFYFAPVQYNHRGFKHSQNGFIYISEDHNYTLKLSSQVGGTGAWIRKQLKMTSDNNEDFVPTADNQPATKKYVDGYLTTITGYDASATQVLKNINGTLTWVNE